jgi:diadenosine tetraphosphate (Ap4A) HIT family hydrolase
MVIARMPSGFAVIGDTQFLPGYCVLLASPQVERLSNLPLPERGRFLLDMSLLGEAIERACRPDGLHRLNYEILGNTDAYLHAHVFPRYRWEPPERLGGPVWHYPRDRWTDARYGYNDATHGALRAHIGEELRIVLQQADDTGFA